MHGERKVLETFAGFSSSQCAEADIVFMLFVSLALEPVLRPTSEQEHFPSHGN
jgi:hypothetical protein